MRACALGYVLYRALVFVVLTVITKTVVQQSKLVGSIIMILPSGTTGGL